MASHKAVFGQIAVLPSSSAAQAWHTQRVLLMQAK
jgi:hypothetical protein